MSHVLKVGIMARSSAAAKTPCNSADIKKFSQVNSLLFSGRRSLHNTEF